MDLQLIKAAITLEGVLSGSKAWELIAEVERLSTRNQELALTAQGHFESRMEVEAERDRHKALADDMNAAANGAFLDGRRNALEEAAQLMEIQSPHLFCDPDDLAGKIRALAEAVRG